MKKILGIALGVWAYIYSASVYAADKFEILPDLPEPLANAALASSVTKVDDANSLGVQAVGQDPNLISVVFSMLFVILLIYATGIIYAKLNKLGFNTLKRQMGDVNNSKVSVVSTTPLGGNKTLHVVELDGKRMLIGASSSSIQLLKDLGKFPPTEVSDEEFSKIEIPSIRIPKIEIPKIEIPGFTKVASKKAKREAEVDSDEKTSDDDNFQISDIYVENNNDENPDGIIDRLFTTNEVQSTEPVMQNEHKVDPDEYALYKKYLEK